MEREIKIYKDYLKWKNTQKGSVQDILEKHQIKRASLYALIKKIQKGDTVKIRQCTEDSALGCLWIYKYEPRFRLIKNNRKPENVQMLVGIIKEMKAEKFNNSQIARYLGKDRATIIHHLNS